MTASTMADKLGEAQIAAYVLAERDWVSSIKSDCEWDVDIKAPIAGVHL